MLIHPAPIRPFGHLLVAPPPAFAASSYKIDVPLRRYFSVPWLDVEEYATLRVTAYDSPPGYEMEFSIAGDEESPDPCPTPTPSEISASGGREAPTPPPSPRPIPEYSTAEAPIAAMKLSLLHQAATAYDQAWHKAIWIRWREDGICHKLAASEVGPRDIGFHQIEAEVMASQPGIEFECAMGMMLVHASMEEDGSWELEFNV